MKLLIVATIAVFALTTAITVPPSWTDTEIVQFVHLNRFRTDARPSVGSEIYPQSRTHVVVERQHDIDTGAKYRRHPNLEKADFKSSATSTDWKPIFPTWTHKDAFSTRPRYHEPKYANYRNYRDDETHEPIETETVEEKHTHREKPLSDHEVSLDIPTRPIYPGLGQWATKGLKHSPFISKHKFAQPEDDSDDVPAGYETFEKNKRVFDKHRDQFRENIDEFPQKHKLGKALPHEDPEEVEDDAEPEYDDDDDADEEFVPTRIYTQVRRSENEEHLPRLVEDPRLREAIKDSKIQTVYTEEGYEDLAYDHAGHEKTAEEDEGYAEFDKEIEKEKERRQYKVVDSEADGSQALSVKRPPKMKKDRLVKSEQVKTTVKNEGDGGMRVVSEVRTTQNPSTNGTTTEKFVRIFPKEYRYDLATTTEKVDTSSDVATAPSPSDALRKEVAIQNSESRSRPKRFTNDFPKISIDTDFIDKIQHDLPKIVAVDKQAKYPYYNDPTLNPYSPLRYAETLDNIPKKTEDDLAFYNQADKTECAEVETDVDPIPKRVKDADADPENAEDGDVQELPKTPRLKGLGDKIDCFKVKYFGEDPLDSPFFQEKELGPVLPLFKITAKKVNIDVKPNETEEKGSYSTKVIQKETKKSKHKNEITQEDLNILTDVINQFKKPKDVETATVATSLKLEVVDSKPAQSVASVDNQTEASVISIITTPKYTIDLKPKHIYHQIELLEYLPYNNVSKTENVTTETTSTTTPASNSRLGKSLDEPTTPVTPSEEAPESQALRYRRPRPRPTPYFQVFDVNKYLPQNPYSSLLNQILRTTTLPKRDIRSGMHYKEAIKASEQLNVFADVINNIKNSSRDPQQIAASSSHVQTQLNPYEKYRKIPVVETDLDDFEETNGFYLSTTAHPIKYSSYTSKEQLFEDLASRDRAKYENLELLKIKRLTTTEPYVSDNRSSSLDDDVDEEEQEEVEEEVTGTVLGLMPPTPDKYTTIVRPQATKPSMKESKMNLFYVLGMKPPSAKQQVYSYADFKPNPKTKYARLRRNKRSAQRHSYSEVVRNRNKPIDVEDDTEVVVEDDDDYVPHRPRNYHYDEKTGRIVYDKVETVTEVPEEEYIEVTEAPIPKPTRKKQVGAPKFANFTGPSFVDYIKLVKSNPNYTEIPDPPTTEKNDNVTTASTTTAKPVSTDPPEFLNLLAKVRSASGYKAIAEKTTTKTKTTTEELEEEEEEEGETQLENVQNSPGGQSRGPAFQIFDINEYLPKVKNYSPRTSIDYSKYKTIERAPVPLRHNLSSRYNSEEEDLENVKTARVPILHDDKKHDDDDGEINPVMSESKHEEVEPTTTTTTTTTTTMTTTTTEASSTPFPIRRRTRPKSRTTRRTTTSSPATTSQDPSPSSHDKAKRVFPRRRAARIKINRTTTAVPDAETEESTSAKVVRRRHQKAEDFSTKSSEPVVAGTTEAAKPKDARGPKKDGDVQVFQKVNQTKRHGGNYRKEEEGESKKVQEVKRLTDVVQKPVAYYMDAKLPKRINLLVEGDGGEEDAGEHDGEGGGGDDDGDAGYDYEGAEEKTTTTKKPFYVKDPDKRMYYYAPV